MLKLRLPPSSSTPPNSEYLPLPLMSRSASVGEIGGDGGTTGAPRPRQLPAPAAAVAALSATRAAATVLMVALEGGLCEAARWHRVQQDMPKCQRLQKVQPFMVGRGVRRSASLVFSPGNTRKRGTGRGLVMGSPSLPDP